MSQDPPIGNSSPRPYDEELHRRAARRVKNRVEFRQHLTSYLVVNGFLVALWAITSRGYFWPIWPILGWGVGLTFHALSLGWEDRPTPAQVAEEAQRLRERDLRRGLPGAEPAAATDPPKPWPSANPPRPGPWDASPGPQDRS